MDAILRGAARKVLPPRLAAALAAALAALCGGARAAPSRAAGPAAPREAAADARGLLERVDAERMAADVRTLVGFGPRMGGTASGERAAAWIAERFAASGLATEVLRDPPRWCHAESAWSLRARCAAQGDAPAEQRALAHAWPWGFSRGGAGSAALALEPAPGVALLSDKGMPRGEKLAPPAVVLTDRYLSQDGEYPALRSLPASDQNPCAVFGIARADGEWLRERARAGRALSIDWQLETRIEKAAPATVLARLPARAGAPPGFFLVCAHGDSDSGGPGANDNGSGEAIVLEMARALAAAIQEGSEPALARELRFAIWGSEIHSSRAYLAQHLPSQGALLGVLNFDQCGFGSGAEQLNIEPDDLPANRALALCVVAELRRGNADDAARAQPLFPAHWATNKSLGGTDSYVFSDSRRFREAGLPALTLFTSAWDQPGEHPRTPGMPGEGWREREQVAVDYDGNYHSAGDLPERTTDREPHNMAWCARAGLAGVLSYLRALPADAPSTAAGSRPASRPTSRPAAEPAR